MPDLRRWPHADALIDAALDRPADHRDAFLVAEAAGDADLLAALRAVLAEAAPRDTFLDPGSAAALLSDGAADADEPPPAWVDRRGVETPTLFPPREYRSVRLSPDGQRAAMALTEDDNADVWVGHLERGVATRLTFEPTVESAPMWTRDGGYVVFRSERGGGGVFRRAVSGTGEIERLTPGGGPIQTPASFAPDGRLLLFTEFRGFREQAIARVDVASGGASVERLLDGPFAQLRPELSPDGRWLAYQSDESGRFEVYVRPYPDVHAGRWQVSASGGTTPRWRRDGRELFFHDGAGVSAVSVTADSTFRMTAPQRLFAVAPGQSRLGPEFDVTADGQRFLMIVETRPEGQDTRRSDLVLVQHWPR